MFVREYHKKFYLLFASFSDLLGEQLAPADILILGNVHLLSASWSIF